MKKEIILKEKEDNRKIVRSELNIEKWPIFTTSNFKGKSRELSREIITEDGKILSKKVIIGKIADKEIGVLRTFEMKGFYALAKVWEEAGKPTDRDVNFSLHQIAEILRRGWGRTTYRQIWNMMDRLRFIPIKWIYSWKQKDDKEEYSIENGFTILASKQIFEKKESKQEVFAFSSFRFHEAILKNLTENYTKPVYLDIILGFKKEISVLLYRQIDLIMADKNLYERRTEELFKDLDLGDYDYPSKRKQLLEPALKELEGVELTTGILDYVKMERTADGKDWKVVFRKSKKRMEIEQKKEQRKINGNTETETVLDLFNQRFSDRRGTLTVETVENLITKYSADKVMTHIIRIVNDGSVNNPAGLLRISLEKDWDIAPDKDEMREWERKERGEMERRRREEEQIAKEKYLQEKEEEEKLDKIFFSLSSEEQKRLKGEARRRIVEEHIDDGQEKMSKLFLRDVMVMIKVREMLRNGEGIANAETVLV